MWWSIYICTYTLLWCACSLNRPSFHSLSFLSWTKNEQTLGAGFSYDAFDQVYYIWAAPMDK
jgi:hypothetical protein